MALDTYAALQTSIAGWMDRADLAAVIPDFIVLAEAQIKRRLRNWTVMKSDYEIAGASTPLPTDCAELRSIRLVSSEPQFDRAISIVTPEQLADHRSATAGVTSRPRYAAIIAGNLVVVPAPDKPYTAEMTYYSKLVALSADNPTNAVLADAPDLYLFGALKEAEPYMEHDERIAVWGAKFESALAELDVQRERQEYGNSLRPVRLPVVF